MQKLMTKLLARLASVYPRHDYHSQLEKYIASRKPSSIYEIETWCKEFDRKQAGGYL